VKLVLILSFLLLACTKGGRKADTVSLSLPQEVATLDPANCYDTVCYVPVAQVYETLFEFEYLKRPYVLRPLLATGFPNVSKDRLTYTFKIKKGIKYHKSAHVAANREVKAQDFITQIKRLAFLPTNARGWWLFDGRIEGLNEWRKTVGSDEAKFSQDVPGLQAPDDETLVIKLLKPYPQILYAMSMNFTSPIPEEARKSMKNDFALTTIGTGPFVVTNYNPNQGVDLERNEVYITSTYPTDGDRIPHERGLLKDAGAKLPFVKNIKMIVIKEAQTDWLNFLKKKIDIINLTKDLYHLALTPEGKLKPELEKDKINLEASPTLIYWWIAFNMKDQVFGNNLNLRKAIAHGVNIDKYIELFTYNVAQKANSIYPPGIGGYSPNADLPYKYDLALAKEFLAKAGYPNGKGLPTLTFDVRGADTRKRQMGEFIQQELRALNIKVDVRVNTFPAFLEKSRNGELQFWQGGWVLDYPDSENVLQLLTSANLPPGPNSSQYTNPKFDELFKQLQSLEEGSQKTALMKQMEDLVNADLPWVMQYYSRNYILTHSELQNFRYSDIIYANLKYVKIK
jgi:oligopeptide transport system substrate-binding protein